MVTGARGVSLHIVMVIVTVLLFISSAMVALGMMNLNLTQSYSNGQVALNEAEAGVARLLYHVTDDDRYGFDSLPELRGRHSAEYGLEECGYVVTFRPNSTYPHSVNNLDGTRSLGYLDRPVPRQTVHGFATGWCRGQVRTIEVLLERPPWPYALASSGKIHSVSPMLVEGTDSANSHDGGKDARPGHVASNYVPRRPSERSIYVGRDGPENTFISGFVQACGPVEILQPAEVRGGIRANGEPLKLPVLDLARYKNQGQPGVVEIVPASFEEQTLDVMYHCAHDLTYSGKVTLENAFLYVQGNLKLLGGVDGVGAIVVDGDVTVQGDTRMLGSNKIALIASGNITLAGGGNYFRGLVYGKGNLDARNISVLGSVIANSSDPARGSVHLENVRLVNDPGASRMTYTSSSSTEARMQQSAGDLPFSMGGASAGDFWIGIPGANGAGYTGWYTGSECTVDNLMARFGQEDALARLVMGDMIGAAPDAAGIIAQLSEIVPLVAPFRTLRAQISALQDQIDPMPAGAERSDLESQKSALQGQAQEIYQEYLGRMRAVAEAYVDYYKSHAGRDGRYKRDGKAINVTREYKLDLNEFLPKADHVKTKYWHVHHGAL
jgi:hypothetical protein